MKVLIWHHLNGHAKEIEGVDKVVRHQNYVQIVKGDESWTYPWRVIHSLKVEGAYS